MNVFLKNTLKFLLTFYGVVCVLVYGTNFMINTKANFKLDNTITKIIIGNSQPECAYNDSIISNFKNIAKSGESYFYNYQKLKQIIAQNPQIKTIFIEFNPTTILTREDEKIWEDRFINHFLPIYSPFLTFNDHALLAYKNNTGYHQAILKSFFKNIKRIRKKEYYFIDSIGGYKYLKRDKTKAILDTLAASNSAQLVLHKNDLSNYDLKYLTKIIALCKQRNITPYLIRTPYHKKFLGKRYETLFQQVRINLFDDIPFLDYKGFSIDDEEFGDLQHLNYKGAAKFSKWFDLYLKKHINK